MPGCLFKISRRGAYRKEGTYVDGGGGGGGGGGGEGLMRITETGFPHIPNLQERKGSTYSRGVLV